MENGIKKCRYCGQEFSPKSKTHYQIYCSQKCRRQAMYYAKVERLAPVKQICAYCKQELTTRTGGGKYCSRECAANANREKTRVNNARLRAERATSQAVAKKTGRPAEPEKTLADWCREAAECNLDYGNYRAQVEVFGKTFEELKAIAAQRPPVNLGSHVHLHTR